MAVYKPLVVVAGKLQQIQNGYTLVGYDGTQKTLFDPASPIYGFAGTTTTGFVVKTDALGGVTTRQITSSGNTITLTNVDGVAGDPNFDIAATYVGQTSITTLGTVTSGTWNASTIDIAHGGTGATTAATAFNALSPAVTSGDLIVGTGTGTSGNLSIGTAGQVLTVSGGSLVWASPAITTFNEQTGTTYTFALSDANYNTMTAFNNASAVTVTLSSVTGFSVGASIDFIQKGVGKVTISPLGVTVNSVSSYLSISAQYGAATLIQESTNVWYLIGSLAA